MPETHEPSAHQSQTRSWELLHNRNFILLWAAYGFSAMGDHLSEMAILKTQDAATSQVDVTSLSGRMLFLFFVPFFLLSPITGWLADRLPRRGIMVVADLARCGLMFAFTALMLATSQWGSWGQMLPLLGVGAFAALFSPARLAVLPTLVRSDQLVRANGLTSGLGIIGTMFAIQLGGWIVQRYENPEGAFRLGAATFLLSAVLLMFLRPPAQHTTGAPRITLASAAGELRAGFRYVLCHRRVIELLLIAALVWFCGPLVKCVIPAIVRDVYGYGENYQAFSNFLVLLGVGFVIGAATIAMLGNALRSEIAITWGLFGIASSIGLFSASVFLPLPPTVLAILGGSAILGSGVFGVAVMASFTTLLQRVVPNRFRGRVFGIKDLGCTTALLLATGTLGIPKWPRLDDWVGYILAGVSVLTFTAAWVTLRTRIRRKGVHPSLTFAQNLNEFIAKWWWRFQRVGPATVPRTGPVIVTANHRCSADPLLLSAGVLYRPISFMVAAEYTNWPIVRWFMRVVDCIPVRREIHDTGATKKAIRHLRAGRALGIFIEGQIVEPGETPVPKDGVAMLALKTGAVVIPAHISGLVSTKDLLRGLLVRHHARVRFGKPVDLDKFRGKKLDRAELRQATGRIYSAIQALAPEQTSPPRADISPSSTSQTSESVHEPA